MTGAGQPIQLVIAERLTPASIRQTRPIADRIVAVFRFVDLLADSCQLVEDRRDLTGGIVG